MAVPSRVGCVRSLAGLLSPLCNHSFTPHSDIARDVRYEGNKMITKRRAISTTREELLRP